MFYLKKILFVLIISTLVVFEAFAGGENRAGTSAAPQLQIPIGSRYLAMSGSAVSLAVGLEAIYWNPAGVALSESNANAMFSYRKYFAGMTMNFLAVSTSLGDLGTFAFSFRSLDVGNINVTTLDQPDGTGEIISPSNFVIGFTYSKRLTDRVSVGTNFNLINDSWGKVKASGVSFDAGVQYRDLFDIPNLSVGVAIKNLGGSIKYDGSALYVQATDPNTNRGPTFLKIATQSAELPSELSIGLAYSKEIDAENTLSFAGSFVNNNFSYDEYRFGMEYSFKDIAYLRAGYLFSPQTTAKTPNIFENYSFGFGLNFKSFIGMDIVLDYAYIPVKFFDTNHSFTLRFGF